MGKAVKEDCRIISIFKLKEWGAFDFGRYGGTITWTSSWSEKENSVSYAVGFSENIGKYFELTYSISGWGEEEKTHIVQKYPLVSTPCYFGGERLWFECSVYRSGVYCGRRVACLYLGSGSHYFACRHCYNLSYDSRNQSRHGFAGFCGRYFDISKKAEDLEQEITTRHYRGEATRKFKRLLKLYWKLGIIAPSLNAAMEDLKNKRK